MGKLLLGVVGFALWVFCLMDVLGSRDDRVRGLPKAGWFVLVLLLPLVGAILWLAAGRPRAPRSARPRSASAFPEYDRPGRATASSPEADQAFLREVRRRAEEQRRRHRMRSPAPDPAAGGPAAARVRVGLTGGVASGKSTVAAILADLGAVVIDADALAREVVAAGTPGFAAVVAVFGEEVVGSDGELDRAALGATVFADPDSRRRLEAIVHPLVRARAAELEGETPPGALVVHDIPLLVETGQARDFDAVVVVDVPVETQVERMTSLRGMSRAEAQARVAAQAEREQRLAAATHVIDNTGTHDDLRRRVTEVVDTLRG